MQQGLWTAEAEKAVHIFKLADDKSSMSEVALLDFKSALPHRAALRPHGMAFVTK